MMDALKHYVKDLLRTAESRVWDAFLKIHSAHKGHGEETVSGMYNDSHHFEAQAHSGIRKIVGEAALKPDDVVYVIGCGKGRALCHFARKPVKKVIGVEIVTAFARQAELNLKGLNGRKAAYEVLNQDACLTDYSDGTVFYFYNPFGEHSFRHVLQAIVQSIEKSPKTVRLIYVNPVHRKVLDDFSQFKRTAGYLRKSGVGVAFYTYLPNVPS
jgi:SAM-dependent methyltransferase